MSENRIIGRKWDRKMILLILGAIGGILLLVFGSLGLGSNEKKGEGEAVETYQTPDPDTYAREVEERIRSLCSQVKGAGDVMVTVSLDGGYRAVYAVDCQTSSTGYKSSTVLIGSGSEERALLIGYENPEIAGIGIVCSGADDAAVRQSILSLVSATFDVGANKIYIASGRVS